MSEEGGFGGAGGGGQMGGMGGIGGMPSTCGNGTLDPGEECDDGNQLNGDACPSTCVHKVLKLDIGSHSVCALLNSQQFKCWGNNDFGQLGIGDTAHRGDEPNEMSVNWPYVDLGTGKWAVDMSSSDINVCVLLNDNHVKCWGIGGHVAGFGGANFGDGPGEMGDNLPYVSLW